MLKRLALSAAAVSLLAAPGVQADEVADMTKGERELAKMLEGRVAGEPERCIRTLPSRNLQTIDDTALVYRQGDTIWVNYTKNARGLDDDDVLVIRRFAGTQLCRTDQITTIDRFGGFYTGFILLDDFVPYTLDKRGV